MKLKNATLLFIGFLVFIILYDALQQYYYLTNFEILGEGVELSLSELIYSHFFRWIIWSFSALPLAWFSWNIFSNEKPGASYSRRTKLAVITLLSWVTAIAILALVNILVNQGAFSLQLFFQNYLFFIVQKGITFLFAYSVLILTLYSNSKNIVIEAQWFEISSLKKDFDEPNSEIKGDPQVSIKIGNRVKLIPLAEVTWIESDDYCVKIHTEGKSYSLRKSLKSLEEQLAPYQFIRVHRGALLNLGYLDQVDFEQSVIKLQDASELPLSKTGAQVLRKVLKASSI